MNPSMDFEQINFNPFDFFNDQDQQVWEIQTQIILMI